MKSDSLLEIEYFNVQQSSTLLVMGRPHRHDISILGHSEPHAALSIPKIMLSVILFYILSCVDCCITLQFLHQKLSKNTPSSA